MKSKLSAIALALCVAQASYAQTDSDSVWPKYYYEHSIQEQAEPIVKVDPGSVWPTYYYDRTVQKPIESVKEVDPSSVWPTYYYERTTPK